MNLTGIWRSFVDLERRAITGLETADVSARDTAITFVAAVLLRNFLELFSDVNSGGCLIQIHYFASYLALLLLFVAIFQSVTGRPLAPTIRVIAPAFLVLSVVPPIDLLLSRGKGFNISYLLPGIHDDLMMRYLTFFGDLTNGGATPGIRIEIAAVLLTAFIYFRVKGIGRLRGALGVLALYTAIFLWGAAPHWLSYALAFLGVPYVYGDPLLASFHLWISLAVGALIALRNHPTLARSLVRDLRLTRMAHFEMALVLGFAVARLREPFLWTPASLIWWINVPIALFLVTIFAIVTNNRADLEIDRIANPDRPLPTGACDPGEYETAGHICLAAGLTLAGLASFRALLAMLIFTGNYWLYSMPPLRIKRVPLLSKLLISANTLLLMLLGFQSVHGSWHGFPRSLYALVWYGFTLSLNFIDLKDADGDRAVGLRTLPVLTGMRSAQTICGVALLGTFIGAGFAARAILGGVPGWLFTGFIFGGVIEYILITRRPYREQPVFGFYLAFLAVLLGYLSTRSF